MSFKAPAEIIQKKRDGGTLTPTEIQDFISGLGDGRVADYQATALLMAIFFRGMKLEETIALTQAMVASGERYDLSKVPGPKIDKHSTGGVGDKVSLVLAPLAAACGLKIPMMSGRGLGHTGGTLDKLAAIPGFSSELTRERFIATLTSVGCAMIGQSEKIVPADRKLYSLRDVTGTVECIPLICASILSKKIAEGASGLVLDIKVGSGAFMKSREQARKLARSLIQVGRGLGLPCRAILTDMNQPLGCAVGNALEVQEAIDVLAGSSRQTADLTEVTVHLCAQMLELGGLVRGAAEGRKLARARLEDGSAWKTFQTLVSAQGGRLESFHDPIRSPDPGIRILSWKAKKRGYIARMNTEMLGRALVDLGGGRKQTSDRIDPLVGIVFHRKLGARIASREKIASAYVPSPERCKALGRPEPDLDSVEASFHEAIEISATRRPAPRLVLEGLQ